MLEADFESLGARIEKRTSLHCRNIFERLWGRSDAFWTDYHGWWVTGFQMWSIHKASVNKVEEERRITAQKACMARSQQKLMLILFFNVQGVTMEEWVLYQKNVHTAFYIKTLRKSRICTRKKRPNLLVLHHDSVPSHQANSTKKFLEKNNMWLMPQPPYSPDLAHYNFFIFLKLKLMLRAASGEFGRNKIENGWLPIEHFQIWIQKVFWWLVTASTEMYSYSGGIFWGG